MDENIFEVIAETLNLEDMGTFYSNKYSSYTITKADMNEIVDIVRKQLVVEFIKVCIDTKKHFNEVDEMAPAEMKSSSDQALVKVVNKITQKYGLKKSKAI